MKAVFHLLQHGRPMLAFEQEYSLLSALKVPNLTVNASRSGWSDNSGWALCEVLAEVTRLSQCARLQSSPVIGASLDESDDYMSVHAYIVLPDFSRRHIFVGLPSIKHKLVCIVADGA